VTQANIEQQGDDELSLIDLLIVLAKYKKQIIGLPIVAGIIAAIVVLIIPSEYRSTTRIMPPVVGQSATVAMLSGMGGGI
jgi:capsular polysaccharide biosynthesis protein